MACPLSADRLEAVVDEIRRTGVAIVKDCFPLADLDRLATFMLAQAAQLDAREAWRLRGTRPRYGTRGAGVHAGNHRHLQQAPPRHAPWVTPGWVCNPVCEQVAAALLGAGAYLSFCDGNTALPRSGFQSLHIDSQVSTQPIPTTV